MKTILPVHIIKLFASFALIFYTVHTPPLLSSSNTTPQPLNIIWDLGDVVVENNSAEVFKQLGYQNVLNLIKSNPRTIFYLKSYIQYDCFYRLMHAAQPLHPEQPQARDAHGVLLPHLMHQWMNTKDSNNKIIATLQAFLNHDTTLFSTQEKALLHSMITTLFTPQSFVKSRALNPDAVKLIKECHDHGHKLYILSNWDTASFALFKEQHKKFFALFDGIVLSGEVGALKPDPMPYKTLLQNYNLDPAQSIFIDDRPENIATARDLGMAAIRCKQISSFMKPWHRGPDIAQVRQKLFTLCAQKTTPMQEHKPAAHA